MARESADYRDNLEMLREMFPGKAAITLQAASDLICRDKRSLLGDKAFPTQKVGNRYIVPIVGLAKYLS